MAGSVSTLLRARVHVPLGRFDLDVDLELGARRTGLFGASGAGKSTLLGVIAGLRRDASGRVDFRGFRWLRDARAMPPERRGIGYVPQDGLLFPHWSVRQNLLAGAHRASRRGAASSLRVDHVVRLLEITTLLDRRVTSLSGGERQRVALGRALCSAPQLLLLDEPFGALDVALRRRLLPLLERAVEAAQVPLVVVSHDPSELVALCDEVVVLSRGRVVAQGEARALLTDPDLQGSPARGYDNVFVGRVMDARGDLVLVRVGSATTIAVRQSKLTAGDSVVLSLRAQDIMVGIEPPRGLSARNVLAARVEHIRGVNRRWLTTTVDADTRLVVELTSSACRQLSLREGSRVHLVFKATSCRVSGTPR